MRTAETDESSGDESAIMLQNKWEVKECDDHRKRLSSPPARRELEDLRRIRLTLQEKSAKFR